MISWAKNKVTATLGYERVYNTDTGEIYKAYNGFTDDYKGETYKSVTDWKIYFKKQAIYWKIKTE